MKAQTKVKVHYWRSDMGNTWNIALVSSAGRLWIVENRMEDEEEAKFNAMNLADFLNTDLVKKRPKQR